MPIPPHLTGVVAKVLRAEEHFGVLDGDIRAYLEMCRDRTMLPTKINPEKNTIRLTFDPMPEASLLISMIIGDCIHNIRSSLDHTWKRLGRSDNFPIFADTDSANNWLVNKAKRLVDIPAGAHAIIDSLQPCHAGKNAPNHPLAMLNTLSNTDKHEAIHLTRPRSKDTRFAFREKGSSHEVFVIRPPVIFHDNTEVLITDVPEGAVKPGMDVNIKGTLFVSFKETGPWADEPVQNILALCIAFVKEKVVGALAPFIK